VIGILLDNALAYGVTEERRSVELEVALQKRRVVIRVIDHGPGLTQEQKAHVFDRSIARTNPAGKSSTSASAFRSLRNSFP
jgi:signal transduction histidine kinase